ncbi:MAG: FKBP-type peptidyl-prolyl cis-trans isomerase N-terminal domain-containing protein [Promethearchaeia archaeon]
MAPDEKYLEENSKKPGVITTATGVQYKVACAPSSDFAGIGFWRVQLSNWQALKC